MKIVVFEDDEDALFNIETWVKEKRSTLHLDVEFDNDLSGRMMSTNWEKRFRDVEQMTGQYLIILDILYTFSEETRKQIKKKYPTIEADVEADVSSFDGLAISEVLLRHSSVTNTLVYVASTANAARARSDQLNRIAESLGKGGQIRFEPTTSGTGPSNSDFVDYMLTEATLFYRKWFVDDLEGQKEKLLRDAYFGASSAEDESDQLHRYFVETVHWQFLFSDKYPKDIIRGPKGAGKSALYTLLLRHTPELAERNVLLMSATKYVNLLQHEPARNEDDFKSFWEIVILTTLVHGLRTSSLESPRLEKVVKDFERANLIMPHPSVVQSFLKFIKSFEIVTEFNEAGQPTAFIRLVDKGQAQPDSVVQFITHYFIELNSILEKEGKCAWLVFDRLDSVFPNSLEVESAAMRALLRVYVDLSSYYRNIKLKLFLREDLWPVHSKSSRESNRFENSAVIWWDNSSLLKLITSRLVNNDSICDFYGVNKDEVLDSVQRQEALFYSVFPREVNTQEGNHLNSLEWLKSRLCDGTDEVMPREIVQFLIQVGDAQRERFEKGQSAPPGKQLFDDFAMIRAAVRVSLIRLSTLLSEHEEVRGHVEPLMAGSPAYTIESLIHIWQLEQVAAVKAADRLIEIGFFKKTSSTFSVPYLYQMALGIGAHYNSGDLI